jgi:2'-5' RNA ligase
MRTFLAVEVPESVRKPIHDFIAIEAKNELPIKWVAFGNLHITLKFLGEIDEKKRADIVPAIEDVCRKQGCFRVRLGGLGCFPTPRNPRVLWVDLEDGDAALCQIAAELERRLREFGFEEEKRFHPHLTIGRVKKPCRVDSILEKKINTDAFEVSSITLFKSTLRPDGPIYDPLDRFTFV